MSLILRSPEPKDAKVFLEHLYIAHLESYRNLDQTADFWKGFSVEKEKDIIEDFLQVKSKFLIAAFLNDKVVGGLGIVGEERPFRTHSARLGMSIQSIVGNKGLGSQMIKYALDSVSKCGLSRIELSVRDYNQPAIHLYEKFGFQRVGLLEKAAKVDGEFVSEYLYQLILN